MNNVSWMLGLNVIIDDCNKDKIISKSNHNCFLNCIYFLEYSHMYCQRIVVDFNLVQQTYLLSLLC